ncbi:MAG: patatin-like phospholipase family protein [Pseudomonadota bacterium]
MVRLPALVMVLFALLSCGPTREEFLARGPVISTYGLSFHAESALEGSNLPKARRPSVLAFSGGGPDGAFGAGVMLGRAEAGDASDEDIVTGVSIGAFIAAFTFTGDEELLMPIFAQGGLTELDQHSNPARAVLVGSLSDGSAYARIVHETVTDEIVARVAAEHYKGRRLFVATTDLDSMRMVVWDMGAIASAPGGSVLLRQILLASASVPGAYPPVRVNVDGRTSLLVDGGVTRQIYIPHLPSYRQPASIFLVFNNSLAADPPLDRITVLSTAQRGLSTLIRGQSRDQVALAQLTAERVGADFTVVSIPPEAPAARVQDFSAAAMARTFALGRSIGRSLAQ